jgi:hypothetical protein
MSARRTIGVAAGGRVMTKAFDRSQAAVARRAAAGVMLAALPVLTNVPMAGSVGYAAVWSAYIQDWTSNVIVDVALYATCFFSPLNSAICGALALV